MAKPPTETFFAVTGSQRPYIYDLPQVLSLPQGFEFRFRYRHQWIDGQLWDRIRNRPESFEGQDLLLLFHSQEEKRIVPLRRASIVRIEELGALVFIRFRLGEFVKSTLLDLRAFGREAAAQRKQQSASWMDAVVQLGGSTTQGFGQFNLAESLPEGWYFRIAAESNLQWSNDYVEAWGGLATMLQDEANLSGVPLFYLLGFEDEHRKLITPSVVRNRFRPSAAVTGYRLVERARYRLRLLTWNGSYPKAAAMRVNSHVDPSILSLEGAADLVLGRYDILEYTFLGNKAGYAELGIAAEPIEPIGEKTEPDAQPEPTGFLGRLVASFGWCIERNLVIPKQQAKPTDQWKTWPAIYLARIPIKMRASIPRALLTFLLAIGGIALYLGAPRLFPTTKAGEPLNTIASGLQALGLLIAFICVSGITEKLIKVREHVIKLGEKPKLPAP